MENIYFKGLEKALNDGCYINVFICSMKYPVVRVEKKNDETNQEELVSYAENGNVLASLNSASSKIVDELSGEKVDVSRVLCDRTLIDNVIEQGYTLHFFKLPNNKVLSTICAGGYGNYIPVKSIITDDIKSGFETLNVTLQSFDFEKTFDFDAFVSSQTTPVYEYQKKLRRKSQDKITFNK